MKLSGGKIMMEMEIPGKFVGKSIGEINIRQVYDVGIILIKQYFDEGSNEKEKIVTPYPEYVFGYSDRILLIGTEENINSFVASF
jgi:K+/H+ antiporter YhaU regulatory subunit KhtT